VIFNRSKQMMWAISNGHYKLFVNANGSEEMCDLTTDPYENNNLLNGTFNPVNQKPKQY